MSEKTIANDILKYGTQSVLKSNDPQSQIRKEDEEVDSPVLADDAFDDSSSSYCTALCSLSDYSEALEDEECMICAEPQCVDASSLATFFADPSGGTSSTTWPETAVPLKELKTEEAEDTRAKIPKPFLSSPSILKAGEEEDEDTGTSQHILDEKSLYVPFPRISNKIDLNSVNTNSADSDQSSADLLRLKRKESLLKPWDYFRSSITNVNTQQSRFTAGITDEYPFKPDRISLPGKYLNVLETKSSSSNPKRNLQSLNIINSVDTGTKTAQPVDSFCTNPLLNSCDYFNNSKTTTPTNTTLVEQSECLEPTFISNTILTTSKVNQYNQEVGQQQSGTKSKADPLTHQQSLRDGPNKLGPEDKLDRGGSMAGHRNWEGEEQGRRVEKEQAELSLKARNRKPPACCISTLTANKQKSGIPPRCYSERILATGHQHPPRSPPVSWRWQKQSRQGVLLSSSLPPKPCSTARQHCSAADNTKDAFNMATKLVKTNTEVRSLDTLDHARSSCPEANYLDVFSSSRWSSNQLSPDEGFHDLSTDVLSIKLPMISTKSHNTSACSEASSVECIDVALESREEVNRGAKTVPKRQIQLKRRDAADSQTNENISNDGLLIPATSSRPRDILQRQHSTPAAFHQDSHGSELKLAQTERKQRLQKSLSLDETSSKTKKASCLIKTILSKKMQEEENLRTDEVSNRAFAPIKAYNSASNSEHLTASTKEVCVETTTKVNLTTGPFLSYSSSSQSTVKEHISVSSKIQPKMMTKHSFNPLFSARSEFPDIGTEITTFPEKSEKENLSSSKEGAWIASQSSGEKLSCDSAKGKVWNSSAGMGKQATMKTTPEECFAVQRGHKQHNVKTDLITSMVKQVKQGESKESTQCLTMAGCLAYDQDVRTLGNILSPSGQCSPEKEPEHDREDPRPPGQSVNMGIQSQGKFKAIAPVHVVRDMRSLVKNTYSLSFRGPGEAAQGTENSMPGFSAASPHQISSKGEDRRKGFKQDEKAQVRKVTPPLALDRIRDLASLHKTPKGCATKPTAPLESHDKSPTAAFTKVSPIIAAKANSCALSKSPEAQCIRKSISQADVQGNITNLKQTNLAGMQALQSNNKTSTEISKNRQSENSSKLEYKKQQDSVEQRQHLAQHYCPPTLSSSSEELESCKPSDQIFSTVKDDRQTPGPPPRPQSTAGPAPACILTVAPTPVLPQYFYKANPLGYQTVSPHMGTVSYVQGPVMLQTPPINQPAAANCPIPLMRSLSEEVRLLSQPFPTDGSSVQQRSSMQQTENGEIRLKMATPDTQQCTAFVATLGAEVMQGSTSMLYQEMGGGLAQSPRQLLLDPETGRCFYVDMPQLPQRKMLFDPQTCQYVEVLLPQQTIPSPVMPSPCAIPVPSLHIPAIYTPHCLPYVQAHPQLLPPPGP
ncbi:proline-rich basic protein 1 [Astyanax mexicanus]|uniref:Proline-rich basic protein 1 n=1 Tax=Astyanax mexicanus TaxID=7994 RepID=A0A8T2L3S4_ASTMX|nr:proline-rich basic protein 1 [Astyanax mexicanus]